MPKMSLTKIATLNNEMKCVNNVIKSSDKKNNKILKVGKEVAIHSICMTLLYIFSKMSLDNKVESIYNMLYVEV